MNEIKLPPYLKKALILIRHGGGEDVGYALGYINRPTALSYLSKLKALGLAYTYRRDKETLEVWATRTGSEWIQANTTEDEIHEAQDL